MAGGKRRLWLGLLIVMLCLGATLGCKRAKPPRTVSWPTLSPGEQAARIARAEPASTEVTEATATTVATASPTIAGLLETLFPIVTRTAPVDEEAAPAPSVVLVQPASPEPKLPTRALVCECVVAPGDTLSSIARAHNTTVAAIMRQNGLASPNVVRVGQRLALPCGDAGPQDTPAPMIVYHTVGRGDTLWKLARRYQTHPREIIAQNKALISDPDQLTLGITLAITVGTGPVIVTHVVQRGETLSGIARRYGVSTQALVQANGLTSPNHVYVGQMLIVPK
jgi:LysM repeat protein